MRYLSLDLEATGLGEHDLIIEFAVVPFCTQERQLANHLAQHFYVKCPSFESLKPKLDPWVVQHNERIITQAHTEGIDLAAFKKRIDDYMRSPEVREYFGQNQASNSGKRPKKTILFGKSMNAIDLPFLNRDLGWDFMREHFHHQILDLSCISMGLIDLGQLPAECASGSGLMKYLGMGEVGHLALEDAKNTALMYLKLLERLKTGPTGRG